MKDTGERLIPQGNTQTLTYGEHLSRYTSVLSLVKGKVVLDVACGSGYGSQMLALAGAKSVHGIDNSNEAVEYARRNYPARNLKYTTADALAIPLEASSFDVIVSFETIEHLTKPDLFMSEVKRLLRPDGIFIVSTPNDDEFMDGNEFHLHEFNINELRSLIKRNFSNSDYYYQGTYFTASLLDEANFTEGITSDSEIKLFSTFGQKTNNAIFYIAVASDSLSLPGLEQNVVLSDKWSTKKNIEHDNDLNNAIRLIQKEKEVYEASYNELHAKYTDMLRNEEIAKNKYKKIKNSVYWKAGYRISKSLRKNKGRSKE